MIMDILLISECFLIIALIVFSFATLRIITYKSTSMGLIGTSSGIVGTIAYAAVMRRA